MLGIDLCRFLQDSITCEYIRQPRIRFAPSRSLMYSYELQKILSLGELSMR